MNRDDLRRTLAALLEEEMGESYDLTDDRDLREGLGLDSVDVVGLVMRVERTYHIRLAMEDLQGIRTVGEMLELVQSKLESRSDDGSRAA
jgi:acyl carrier protein